MTTRLRLVAVCAFVCLMFVGAGAPDRPATPAGRDVEIGEQLITPQKLKLHLSFIASDELEGRATPSRGLDLAARYIASHLEYYGYQPAGDDGTYFQKIAMSRRKPSRQSRLHVDGPGGAADFLLGSDFLGSAGNAKGKLVFAGYGLTSKEADYDDYAGLDVKGKLAVVFDGLPPGMDPKLFKVPAMFNPVTRRPEPSKFSIAVQHGAVGVVTLKDAEYMAAQDGKPSPFHQSLSVLDRESVVFDFRDTPVPAPMIDLTPDAAKRLEQALGVDFAAARSKIAETKKQSPVSIDGSFESEFKYDVVEKLTTQNVVGFLEGSDPKLKDEIVAFSAHYDHLGSRQVSADGRVAAVPGAAPNPAASADRIYNGADDDGSGTVGILNLAEAFAGVSRPRRSLLFIWHAGEELNLIGSEYFVRNPVKPLDKFAALFNIDMIGRNFEDKEANANHVYLVGAAKTSREFNEIIHRIAGDRMRLDETDARNYFRRSDHFHYARNRIPVVFFCTGEHKDYHQPSDEVRSIRFDKMKQILDIVFECGLDVANRDTRPAFTGEGF